MRTTSALYKSLRAELGSFYQVRVWVVTSGATYGHDKLRSCKIRQSLSGGSGLSVGGVVSAQCDILLREDTENWPRMAEFQVQVRIVSEDETQTSEWLTMGTFYTDERQADRYGNLSITGFDAMLKTEQSWTDKVQNLPANWPITASAAAALLSEATGIQLDARNNLDNTVAFIGLDTTSTAREVLSTIAAAQGGNWQITPNGRLLLVTYQDMDGAFPAIAGIAVAGISVVGDTNYVSGAGQNAEYTYVGLSLASLTVGEPLSSVTGVRLEAEDGTVSQAGTDTGYVVKGQCNFSTTTGVAALCLSALQGKSYKPFNGGGAFLDPAAELGDMVIVDGRSYQIGQINWNLSNHITAEIGAPYEEEVDHEYTADSSEARHYRKTLVNESELRSYITQTAAQIRLEVQEIENQIDHTINLVASDYAFVKTNGAYSPAVITIADTNAKSSGTYTWYEDGTIITNQTGPDGEIVYPHYYQETLRIAPGSRPMSAHTYKCVWNDANNRSFESELSIAWLEEGSGYSLIVKRPVVEIPVEPEVVQLQPSGTGYYPTASGAVVVEVALYRGATEMTAVVPTTAQSALGENEYTLEFGTPQPTGITAVVQAMTGNYKYARISYTDANAIQEEGFLLVNAITADGVISTVITIRASMNAAVVAHQSSITQNADKIALVVEEVSGTNVIKAASIITAINDDTSSVTISAQKVNITGYVTFSDLSTAGSTTISGSNITTGTINANNVTITNLNASNITSGYISANRISGGSIDADTIYINGAMYIYNGNSYAGFVGAGNSANAGVGAGASLGYSSNNYFLATSSGVRMTAGGTYSIYCTTGTYSGCYSSQAMRVGSDRRLKENINYDINRYDAFFDGLKPCSYMRKDTPDGKTHIGLIAQDVVKSIDDAELQAENFYGLGRMPSFDDDEPNYYCLAYEEFIGLCIDQIQKLKARVAALEGT